MTFSMASGTFALLFGAIATALVGIDTNGAAAAGVICLVNVLLWRWSCER